MNIQSHFQASDALQNRLNAAATDCKKELNAQQGTQGTLRRIIFLLTS